MLLDGHPVLQETNYSSLKTFQVLLDAHPALQETNYSSLKTFRVLLDGHLSTSGKKVIISLDC